MMKKLCNRCGEFSYSAVHEGRWVCPICGKDLTKEPLLKLSTSDILPRNGMETRRSQVIPFKAVHNKH